MDQIRHGEVKKTKLKYTEDFSDILTHQKLSRFFHFTHINDFHIFNLA